MKTTIQPVIQNSIECPECGKNTVVEVNSHLYQCISCDFYRELSVNPSKRKRSKHKHHDNDENKGGILSFVIVGLLLLMFI